MIRDLGPRLDTEQALCPGTCPALGPSALGRGGRCAPTCPPSRIRNYRRMQQRRVVNTVRVVYGTPHDKLEAIPGMLREIVEPIAGVRFDRAHLSALGESALEFELVYYVLSADFNAFMDRQQTILLGISRRFQQAKIEFAFPTRTVLLHPGTPIAERGDGQHAAPGHAGRADLRA